MTKQKLHGAGATKDKGGEAINQNLIVQYLNNELVFLGARTSQVLIGTYLI